MGQKSHMPHPTAKIPDRKKYQPRHISEMEKNFKRKPYDLFGWTLGR